MRATKALLDWASLPPDKEFGPGLAAFFRTFGRPENAARVMYLFEFLTVAYRIHCVDGGVQIRQPCVVRGLHGFSGPPAAAWCPGQGQAYEWVLLSWR
jgi:hypothetical protein